MNWCRPMSLEVRFRSRRALLLSLMVALSLIAGPAYAVGARADAAPYLVKDIRTGVESSGLDYLLAAGNIVYFAADDGLRGLELWKSNGTSEGTVRVKNIARGAGDSNPHGFAEVNGTVFFVADDGAHGRELWKSNGKAGGTVLVKDIRSGAEGSNPDWLTNVEGVLYFTADDGFQGASCGRATAQLPARCASRTSAPAAQAQTPIH